LRHQRFAPSSYLYSQSLPAEFTLGRSRCRSIHSSSAIRK